MITARQSMLSTVKDCLMTKPQNQSRLCQRHFHSPRPVLERSPMIEYKYLLVLHLWVLLVLVVKMETIDIEQEGIGQLPANLRQVGPGISS